MIHRVWYPHNNKINLLFDRMFGGFSLGLNVIMDYTCIG